jgi:RNA polymerase sigma-70 factor (ECF subfamily)
MTYLARATLLTMKKHTTWVHAGVFHMAVDRRMVPLHVVPPRPGGEPNDADLARALIAGELWATATTWNRFAPIVYGIASRALGRDAEAEDVTQEVFYRLFARVNTLRNPEAFRSFVVSFAIRIVKWELRRRRARRWIMLSESDHLPDVASLEGDPESREVLRRFYVVLDQLSARERLVFALRYLESMTLEEIAIAMPISLSTVKRTLARAAGKVSQWIEGDEDLAHYFEGKRGDQ